MSNEPKTWAPYSKAVVSIKALACDGIGWMFGDGFIGVDIDHCVNTETGEVSELASEIMAALNSYSEFSPSGTGIHIICKGTLPAGGRKNTALGLEMYAEGRFFTVTGDRIGSAAAVEERTDALAALHAKYMKPVEPEKERPRPAPTEARPDDDELMRKALASKSGAQIEQLFNGNWRGLFPSQSEADLAFCNSLAFWAACDAVQMDRIFRRSGLMREKWDNARNGTTYGQDTIDKAIKGTDQVYKPKKEHSLEDMIPDAGSDPTEASEEDPFSMADIPVMFAHEAIPDDAVYYSGAKKYEADDTGNAGRFHDLYGQNARYCHTNRMWYIWNGMLWMRDANGSIKRMAEQAINVMRKEFDTATTDFKSIMKMLKRVRSSTGKEAMIKEAQHLCPIAQEEMDKDDNLLNLLNGIYDMDAGTLLPHARERYMTRICQAEYIQDAPKPKMWLAFMNDILGGDDELVRFLQKAVGYSMSGFAVEQCMFIMFGTGANGKGTFINTIREMLGGYLQNAQAETVMIRERGNGSAASGDIARLKSCRFVTCAETEEGKRLSEALIKQMTGEDAITCRFLFSEEFEYVPRFKIWLATNHKPVIKGTDTGIWRRIHMIPFRVTITEDKRDPHLGAKLRTELPGILQWALEGYRLWRAEGLKPPRAVKDATAEYRSEMDIVAQFLAECTQPDTVLKIQSVDLYIAYKRWSEINGEKAMTTTKFGLKLAEHNLEKLRTGQGVAYGHLTLSKAGQQIKNGGSMGYGERLA